MIISAGICQPTVIATGLRIPQQNGADLSLVSNGPCRAVMIPAPQNATPTTWFVRKSGLNTHDGKTPATAFLTIAKALTSISVGDTVFIGAGVYRELLALPSIGSNMQPTSLIGDDGSYTGDFGEVVLSSYTAGDFSGSQGDLITINGSASWFTFTGLTLQAVRPFNQNNLIPTGLTLRRCVLNASGSAGGASTLMQMQTSSYMSMTIDSCIFFGGGGTLMTVSAAGGAASTGVTTGSGPDFNLDIHITNCLLINLSTTAFALQFNFTSALRNSGGVSIKGCTFLSAAGAVVVATSGGSIGFPVFVSNCWISCGAAALALNSSAILGALVEDYNVFNGNGGLNNVTLSKHSFQSSSAPPAQVELGQSVWRGAMPRPFFQPASGSVMSVFGSASPFNRWGEPPPVDIFGSFRPYTGSKVGPASATTSLAGTLGYVERVNNWGQETITINTGLNAISVLGPGSQDFELPVDATQITVSMFMQYDTSYVGILPTLQVLGGTQIGVQPITVSMTVSSGQWQQLSATFTPSAAGIVTIRVASYDTSLVGHAYADTFAVA